MQIQRKVMNAFGIGAALLTSLLLLFSAIAPAQEENAEVSRLLSDAKQKSAVVSQDADQLEALTRTEVSWQSHAAMLEKTKQDVNDLGRVVQKLEAARDSASPWQRQAIDRTMPLMKELASNLTAAINQLNKTGPTRPTSSAYTEYLKANTDSAHDLATMISSFEQYGRAKAKFEKLSQKLEVASQ